VQVTDVNRCQSIASAATLVTIQDILAPMVVTQDITVELDATGNVSITAADIDNGSSDACGIARCNRLYLCRNRRQYSYLNSYR